MRTMSKSKSKTVSKMSYDRKDIDKRVNKVKSMYFEDNLEIKEIAEKLKVNRKTIERDLKLIKIEFSQEYEIINGSALLKSVVFKNKKLINKYWSLYKSTSDVRNKSICLKNIHKIEMNNIELFEKAGIVEKLAEHHIHSGFIDLAKKAKEVLDKK